MYSTWRYDACTHTHFCLAESPGGRFGNLARFVLSGPCGGPSACPSGALMRTRLVDAIAHSGRRPHETRGVDPLRGLEEDELPCQELLAGLYRLTEPRTFSTAAQPLAQDGGSIGGPATQPFWKEL